jgi:hypothetical protein
VHDSVATEDHRGETACDDREKKPGCDGVLHREGPQRTSPGRIPGQVQRKKSRPKTTPTPISLVA